ncbi:hypothetical protein ColTof4_02870 [Colletotrichum tofieldiae]|nr:hypothetical protein ColTof3_08832 [Colletotrichum tofieldiae]GKT70447.1 hypothetical protein ColTof4_02870 [Colletotrichum tofieldiae]GKT93514.1 hypothetical protein Ct61P_11364 [Colletotrichum tofieldiae]
MRAIHFINLIFSSLALAGGSEECLNNLKGLFTKKGVTDQPGLDTFGGACKGTRVIKEKLTSTSAREEWLLYSCCQKINGDFGQARLLPLQNCLAFNDAGGGTLTWKKSMRMALPELIYVAAVRHPSK